MTGIKPAKLALILGVVLLVCGLVAYRVHFRPKWAVEDYKQQLRAAGEKLTIEELLPRPVPSEQNSADVLLRAFALLNLGQTLIASNPPPSMRMVAPGKAMIGWAQPDIRENSWATNTWEEAEADLAQYGEALELFHQIIDRPALDFELQYEQGLTLLLPHLAPMKVAAQRLSAAAICDLHRGDAASAVTNLRSAIAIVKGSGEERLVISQLVRVAIAQIALAANWGLLQATNVTDAQLADLQQDWTELEFLQAGENALAMQRASAEATLEQMGNSAAYFQQMTTGFGLGSASPPSASGGGFSQMSESLWQGAQTTGREFMWRFAWSCPDELTALKGDQIMLDAARLAKTNGFFQDALRQQQHRLAALHIERLNYEDGPGRVSFNLRSFFSQSVLSLNRYLSRVMQVEVARQMAVTAIALKRYQLRHGSYPADLASLVPEFLPGVPRDPVDGQPLRYRRSTGQSFLLYSIGEDGEDNGGDTAPAVTGSKSFAWQNGRDWVWPQPATSEEIQAYYSEQSKK